MFKLQVASQIGAGSVAVLKYLLKKEFLNFVPCIQDDPSFNATNHRGVACTIVKIPAKEFTPFFLLAVDWQLKICDSDT
jgi:hypothetical protein